MNLAIKICPYCKSEIDEDVKKCKFCGEWVDLKNRMINCINCGQEHEEWAKICPHCDFENSGNKQSDETSKHRIFGLRVSIIIAIIAFLLPFVSLSCGGRKLITMTGTDMVIGTSFTETNPATGESHTREINPNIYAIISILSLGAAISFSMKNDSMGRYLTAASSGVGTIFLFLLKSDVDQRVATRGNGLIAVDWQFGFWAVVLVAILSIVIAIIPIESN